MASSVSAVESMSDMLSGFGGLVWSVVATTEFCIGAFAGVFVWGSIDLISSRAIRVFRARRARP